MRLRKVKDALIKLEAHSDICILNPKDHKGKWNELFENDNKVLNLEIGCGKGRFSVNMAKLNTDINFIAFEKFDSVILRALELYLEDPQPNLRLVLADAENLLEYFSEDEISNLYLNFSDPWPKARHAKRRLTSKSFLDQYKVIIKEDGAIYQKTDNRHLFEYSLVSYSQNGMFLDEISLDLHKEDRFNVETEFEEKWKDKGPIYFAKVKFKND